MNARQSAEGRCWHALFPLYNAENPLSPQGRSGHSTVPVHPWNGATGSGQREILRAALAPHLVHLDVERNFLALG